MRVGATRLCTRILYATKYVCSVTRPGSSGPKLNGPPEKQTKPGGGKHMSRTLKMGGSLIAMAVATSFFATAAYAQSSDLEEVVVTGSSIRGVAPVGWTLGTGPGTPGAPIVVGGVPKFDGPPKFGCGTPGVLRVF